MAPPGDCPFDMSSAPLDPTMVDRLLSGTVGPDDAPPGLASVARILADVRQAAAGSWVAATEATTVVAMASAITQAPSGARANRLWSVKLSRTKLAVAGVVGALTFSGATTAMAAANVLPSPVQSVASDLLAKVGVNVPAPSHDTDTPPPPATSPAEPGSVAGTHGANSNTPPSTTQGSQISNLAHTTPASGDDKGAVVSGAASDGHSQAGQHEKPGTAGAPAGGDTTPGHGISGSSSTSTTPSGHTSHGSGVTNPNVGGHSTEGAGNDTSILHH